MATMRAVQVSAPKADFQLVERPIPEPAAGEVRIKMEACGICRGDSLVKEGNWPGIQYPRVPGHEVAGVIDKVGPDVPRWKQGQRVGVGWYAGHCGYCDECRHGHILSCSTTRQITAISRDGGYADYMIASAQALVLIPDELKSVDAAPLMCAGITTFNALRNSGAVMGDTVAVLGIGGLGHLGVQFAARAGFRTIAIARGQDKAPLAKKLGAHVYIDSLTQDPAAELNKLGGAKIILATVTDAKTMSTVLNGLANRGKMVIVGASHEPMQVNSGFLLGGRRTIAGWAAGTAADSQDTLAFSALTGITPMTETFPLERAAEAYNHMMSGKARFRAVLTTTAS
jgi:D-arabinose 1-dehydrogenase-like Zn-dependent alcohol dehydrogenase